LVRFEHAPVTTVGPPTQARPECVYCRRSDNALFTALDGSIGSEVEGGEVSHNDLISRCHKIHAYRPYVTLTCQSGHI